MLATKDSNGLNWFFDALELPKCDGMQDGAYGWHARVHELEVLHCVGMHLDVLEHPENCELVAKALLAQEPGSPSSVCRRLYDEGF